jgi:YD repeat-containing protein
LGDGQLSALVVPALAGSFLSQEETPSVRSLSVPGVGTIIVSGGPITSWTDNADGQVTCEQDPLGGNTWTQYNMANLPVAVTDALGAYAGDSAHTTMTEYDQMGDVTEVTDPLGRSVIDVYNSLGEKTEEIDPAVTVENDGGTSTVTGFYPTTYFGYDADGNVQYVTEPRGDSDVGGEGPGGATYTTWYFYLCLCQLAVTDFSMFSITLPAKLTQPLRWAVVSRSFCYRCSQGTSRCSLAHRSMAA